LLGAFWNECLATDPPAKAARRRACGPDGVLEDSFYQAAGRPLWNAAKIFAPTLVIGGDFALFRATETVRAAIFAAEANCSRVACRSALSSSLSMAML